MAELQFESLGDHHPGVTVNVAAYFAEAARVCFDRHHTSPKTWSVTSKGDLTTYDVTWVRTDTATKAAHQNVDDATRDGAYAMALAVVEKQSGLVAIGRADIRSGADYFVAPRGTQRGDFEQSYRLEISGVDRGDDRVIVARLHRKIEQARRGDSDLPALAAVVGFRSLIVLFEHVDAK